METPIPQATLDEALACQLVDTDGTRWEVLDVTFDEGRAWIRARRYRTGPYAQHSSGDGGGEPDQRRSPGVVERIVSPGALLIWVLRDGRQLLAKSGERGALSWEIEEPARAPHGSGSSSGRH